MSADWYPVALNDCDRHHPSIEGPCVDVGQCEKCYAPIGVLRPPNETFGFHSRDCSLPERHFGFCAPGGNGHPPGHIRGYWPGFEADVTAEREWWLFKTREASQ